MYKQKVEIKSSDFWIKTLDMLQQNWALIEKDHWSEASKVVFVNDSSGVIDFLDFPTEAEAKTALLFNGFRRYADDEKAQEEIAAPPPPYYAQEHSFSQIYSSGHYWRKPPEASGTYERCEVLSIERASRVEWALLFHLMESTLKNQLAIDVPSKIYAVEQGRAINFSEYLSGFMEVADQISDQHFILAKKEERLCLVEWKIGPNELPRILNDIVKSCTTCKAWIDNLFWLFWKHCCKAQPLCDQCEVRSAFFCKVIPKDFDAKAVEILKIIETGTLPLYESQYTLFHYTHNGRKHYVLTKTTMDDPEFNFLTEQDLHSMGRREFKRIDTNTGNRIDKIIDFLLPEVDVVHDERLRCDGGSIKMLIGTRRYEWRSGLVPTAWWLLDEIVNRLRSY